MFVFASTSFNRNSVEKLSDLAAAEAKVATDMLQIAQAKSSVAEEASTSDTVMQVTETTIPNTENGADVRLHPRAVRDPHSFLL